MLVPGSEFDEPNEWLTLGMESLSLYPEFTGALEEESGEPIDFSVCGTLELADSEEHFAWLQRRAAGQATLGIECETVDAMELPRWLRPGLGGAIYYRRDGQVDPRTVMAGLRKALLRRGVRVIEGDGAVSFGWNGSGATVTLRSGMEWHAERLILAAGAWTTAIASSAGGNGTEAGNGSAVRPQPLPEAAPVKGHLAGYHLAPNTLPHVLRFHDTYVVQRRSGYTITGASVEHAGFNRTVELKTGQALAMSAHELVPGLLPPRPHDVWMGFRPGIAAEGPRIGRWGDSCVWLAYGHYRNGILFAPATAARICRDF